MRLGSKEFFSGAAALEPYFFGLLVLANLIPVLGVDYFPTVDGPSHLYNARLIAELWADPNGAVSQYLRFNETITPNWTGHLLLSGLLTACSAAWAEKIILLVYLIGFPVGFRYLFNAAEIPNKLLVYLIFPFTYSFLFHYGFYNFNVGLVLFFFGIGLWFNYLRSNLLVHLGGLALVSILISLSHPFVFILFVMVLFILNLREISILFNSYSEKRQEFLRHLAYPFTTLIPGLVVTGWFILSDDSIKSSTATLAVSDLFTSLKYIMPIKGIELEAYDLVSRVMLYLFFILTVTAFLNAFRTWRRARMIGFRNGIWFLVAFTTLVLLFVVPDYLGTAGLISARLLWFFFIFLIVWLASIKLPKWLVAITFLLAIGVTIWTIDHNYKAISKPSLVASELSKASEIIESYSTVLPITIRKSKPFVHVSNYLGVEKPIILLHNYEAALTYFPLKWRYENIVPQNMGSMTPTQCISWIGGKSEAEAVQIDYVCIVVEAGLDMNLACQSELETNLNTYYELVYANLDKTIRIYRRLDFQRRRNSIVSTPSA